MKRALVGVLVAAGCTAGCVKRPPALPDALRIEEFAVPWENAFPSDVAVDAQGRVWFTDRMAHVIGRFDPERNEFARFAIPTPKSAPYGLVSTPDGTLWFAESTTGRLGRVDVSTGTVTEVPLPGLDGGGPHLLAWSGGRIWFTAREARRWGWYEPATGRAAVHAFAAGEGEGRMVRGARPYAIAPAPAGGVWIGTYDAPWLLRARPGVDTLEQRLLPAGNRRAVGARRAASDAAGTLWIADFLRGRVLRVPAAGDTITAFSALAQNAAPYGIGIDPWGRTWFHELMSHAVIMLDPASGERALVPVGHREAAIRHIAFDAARRRVWLPISDAGVLGLIRLR